MRTKSQPLALLFGAISLLGFLFLLVFPRGSSSTRDRWWRDGLADRYPCGETPQLLMLVNSGSVPAFAEIRHDAWDEVRCELLLPGQSQVVALPSNPKQPADVRLLGLDLSAEGTARRVELPSGWNKTFVDVDEEGGLTIRTRPGGDTYPDRGYFGAGSAYALPVRFDVPFDAHERPSAEMIERHCWVGPGTGDGSAHCAFALDRAPVVTVLVPQRTSFEKRFTVASEDVPTRLTVSPDGTVVRDEIPTWRRIAHFAARL